MSEHIHTITCRDDACSREFLTEQAMQEHAEAVHTFDDTRQMVQDKVRDVYGQKSNYANNVPGIYTWIRDLADDWVVFEREISPGTDLYKASYSVVDSIVTLGEAYPVQRRTVYEPVKDGVKLEQVNQTSN